MGRRTTGAVGRAAEQHALAFLLARDFKLVTKNFHSRGGEIDLIMLEKDCLVFIEVRYRASAAFAAASHTVDHRKQQKIIRTAAMYIARNSHYAMHTMRFDVIAIEGTNKLAVQHITDAFRPRHSSL